MTDPQSAPIEFTEETLQLVSRTLDVLPFYAMLIDEDHHILAANAAVRTAYGKSSQEICGGHCPREIHGTDDPFPGCPLDEAVRIGRGVETELKDEATGGWVKTSVHPLGHLHDKRVYLHLVQDISKWKKMELELSRAAAKR